MRRAKVVNPEDLRNRFPQIFGRVKERVIELTIDVISGVETSLGEQMHGIGLEDDKCRFHRVHRSCSCAAVVPSSAACCISPGRVLSAFRPVSVR